ncbi:hypothetical protein, conserved [Leishmania tarentolae]|uniref:Uncharacterized protein n=1 Tax=Leishmania tarentolae TaxID=5689 RepID=A0A640KDY8_LEITA|nr:hypothetical protein, conserved [Leishmania tarentolae]
MDAAVDAADPRVAPAVQQLSSVAQRVYAVWQRMGVASRDRQQRWNAFLFGSLLPFLDDFGALQEAAESNAAAENDALLQDVCHLAVRLDESPRQPEVASIVSLLKEHYAQTQQRYPLTVVGGKGSIKGDDVGLSGTEIESVASQRSDGNVDEDAQGGVSTSRGKEFMYLSIPSFVTLIKSSCPSGPHDDNDDEPHRQKRVHQQCGAGSDAGDGNDERGANVSESDARSAATCALRRLLHNNTHEGVRQQLQAELDRLQRLADNRLQVLQLLCKQRAIINRSAQEQVVLRAAYRARYLSKEEDGSGSDLGKRVSLHLNSVVYGKQQTTIAIDAASTRSSGFISPLTSPKTSISAEAAVAPSNGTCDESSRDSGAHKDADAIELLVNRPTTALQDATREELQLLLGAASCSLDGAYSSTGGDSNVNHPLLEHSGEGDPGSSTWQACSSTTETTEARFTAQAATPSTGVLAAAKSASVHAKAVATSPLGTPPGEAARATVLEVDVSSVTAYGTHQDLTLARIQAEAEVIVRSIDEHNRLMQLEVQEELHALNTLEVLWRAMSVQKRSPKASSPLSIPHRCNDEAESHGTASGSIHGNSQNENAVARPAKTSLCSSPLTPFMPEPYRKTIEEIIAQYRQLHAAYEADVAAQQQQPSLAAVDDSDNAHEQKDAYRTGGGLYLPPAVRQVLRAASYAPVLDHVRRARASFQAHLSTQQDMLVEKTMARLRDVYEAYYAATRDTTYAVAPDGELRVAMEEELLETIQSQELALHTARQQQPRRDVVDEENANSVQEGEATTTAAPPPPPSPSGKVLLSFQRHLKACQQVREQAADEIEFLRLRLHIIEHAAPLVQNYQEILREEAEMRATSRERLLNKKVNMAKQLLQEEKTRRRVAKELPRIVSHLKELVAAWDALQAATDPREDTADGGSCHKGGPGAPVSTTPASAKAELWIHGQRVRDLLTASQTSTAPLLPRVRCRSASSPPPLRSHPPARSVSPVPPALVRHRVEQRLAGPHCGASEHLSRKGSPTPAHTSLPRRGTPRLASASAAPQPLSGRHRVAAAGNRSGEDQAVSAVRSGDSPRPHSNTTSPAVRSYTPPHSQPATCSYKPASLRPLSFRVPSRSPPPLLPRRGLSPVSSNRSPQIQKRIAHPSTSPSPSSASATTTRVNRAPVA